MKVSRSEYNLLFRLAERGGSGTPEELAKELGLPVATIMSMIERLAGLIRTEEKRLGVFRLTEEGARYREVGLPEIRLCRALRAVGGEAPLSEVAQVAGLSRRELGIAIGHAKRLGYIEVKGGVVRLLASECRSVLQDLLQRFDGEMRVEVGLELYSLCRELVRRGLAEERVVKLKRLLLTSDGLRLLSGGLLEIVEEKTVLTSDDIVSGRWRRVKLKYYDVSARPPKVYPGRRHFYSIFLEEVRRILLEMGFREAEGPFVELEFWNFDALFQAQDHPAREIHDSYRVAPPNLGRLPAGGVVERVRRVHEDGWTTGSKGWGYKWSADIARRLILRTQTTAVSVRYLYEHGDEPVKVFALSRNFRPDVLDPTHSMEFHQCEGIVVGDGLTFANLLGFLKEFAKRLGIEKVRFRPAYFPFTEPSVEGYVYHDRLGWIEALPGGMFRPEVRLPLGVKKPVLAWGIGIGRLAMAAMGIDDIRDLFTRDIEKIRNARWVRIAENKL